MNLTSSKLLKKAHLTHGGITACNRKASGNGVSEFFYNLYAEKYPEECCKICLSKFNHKLEIVNKKNLIKI
tara:strand:- start:373 stop:585 length:213 start_codon:yes stop_codon:yes gene_type:complete